MKIKLSVWNLILLMPVADTLNGMADYYGWNLPLSIGVCYRLLLILFFTRQLLKDKRREHILTCVLIGGLLMVSTLSHGLKMIGSNLESISKWFFPVICMESLLVLSRDRQEYMVEKIKLCFQWFGWIVPFTILIPYLLGIGNATYSDAGYKGFYISTNDLSILLEVIYVYTFKKILEEIKIRELVKLMLILASIVLLGTKSSYAVTVFSSVVLLFLFKRQFYKSIFFVLLFVAMAGGAVYLYWDNIQMLIMRTTYFYNNLSFWSFITSSRIDRIIPFMHDMADKGIFAILLGNGQISYRIAGVTKIEMDFFDLIYEFGVIGFTVIGGYYLRFLRYARKNSIDFFMFLIILINSFFAGHVLATPLSGMMLALVIVMMVCDRQTDQLGDVVRPYRKKTFSSISL